MTPEQVQLIRLTFVQVMNRKQEAGRLFYERLFSIAPDTRPMFRSDIDAQSQKLMDTLLWTLERMLGPAFTPAARDAWTALYGTVAQVMRKAGSVSKAAAG